MSTLTIKNKTIIVTGGANGLGKGLVQRLHTDNQVIAVDLNESKLKELEKECPGIKVVCVDLSDWDKTREVLDKELPNVVHMLVNNAGIGSQSSPLECPKEELEMVINVNTRAIVNISQIFAKRIISYNEGKKEEDKVLGSVVNISSLASRMPTRVSIAYNVSKAAVDMITKVMSLELAQHNIRTNSVNPGIVAGTDLSNRWIENGAAVGHNLKAALMSRTPLNRMVQVDDIVNAVLFLLNGERINSLNGESLLVEGGYCVT